MSAFLFASLVLGLCLTALLRGQRRPPSLARRVLWLTTLHLRLRVHRRMPLRLPLRGLWPGLRRLLGGSGSTATGGRLGALAFRPIQGSGQAPSGRRRAPNGTWVGNVYRLQVDARPGARP